MSEEISWRWLGDKRRQPDIRFTTSATGEAHWVEPEHLRGKPVEDADWRKLGYTKMRRTVTDWEPVPAPGFVLDTSRDTIEAQGIFTPGQQVALRVEWEGGGVSEWTGTVVEDDKERTCRDGWEVREWDHLPSGPVLR